MFTGQCTRRSEVAGKAERVMQSGNVLGESRRELLNSGTLSEAPELPLTEWA